MTFLPAASTIPAVRSATNRLDAVVVYFNTASAVCPNGQVARPTFEAAEAAVDAIGTIFDGPVVLTEVNGERNFWLE